MIIVIASITYALSYMLRPERIFDSDTLWHIKAGEWIIANHTIPKTDPFSWSTPGAPWVAHEWLFEVVLALLYKQLGPAGIIILCTLLILSGLFLYWKLIYTISNNEITASVFYILALLLPAPGWAARPQLMAYLLFVGTLYLVYAARSKPVVFWLLPPVFLLWANCHASVLLGLGIIGLETMLSFIGNFENANLIHVAKNKRKLVSVFTTCALASLINPNGVNLWWYCLKVSTDPIYKVISEWQSPTSPFFISGIFLIVSITMLFAVVRKNKAELFLFLLALLTLFGTMNSIRHFPYFIFTWGLLACQLAGKVDFRKTTINVISCVLAIISVFTIIKTGLPGNDPNVIAEKAGWPVKATDWLEEQNAERIFNQYNWGGYLIYRGIPVFVDGRSDMYHMAGIENDPFVSIDDFRSFKKPPNEVLQNNDAKYVLIPGDAPQVYYLKECGWKEVYSDEKSIVLKN